jgi:cell division protein FtsB
MHKNLLSQVKDKLQKYVNYILILLTILLAISLVRNIFRKKQVDETIIEEEVMVEDLRKENEELKKELQILGSDEYKERQLRDKLGLAKEGELIVILPDEEILRKLAPKSFEEEETLPDPNWKKWMHLFF